MITRDSAIMIGIVFEFAKQFLYLVDVALFFSAIYQWLFFRSHLNFFGTFWLKVLYWSRKILVQVGCLNRVLLISDFLEHGFDIIADYLILYLLRDRNLVKLHFFPFYGVKFIFLTH